MMSRGGKSERQPRVLGRETNERAVIDNGSTQQTSGRKMKWVFASEHQDWLIRTLLRGWEGSVAGRDHGCQCQLGVFLGIARAPILCSLMSIVAGVKIFTSTVQSSAYAEGGQIQ
jgi:hypothetical protein